MKKIIIVFILITVFASCKKADRPECENCLDFYFESPQPENDSELNGFPSKFKGLYMDKDSIYLRIEEDRILQEYFIKFKVHKQKMDSLKSEYNLVDAKLITKDTKEKYKIYRKGDSIELAQKFIDTLFRLSYNQKAKRINGQLILNTKDSVLWKMKTISLENNILKIKEINLPEDLRKFDSVTLIKGKMLDSLSYLIKPTRREFKNILKIKNFGTDKKYKKVSK
ncbi:hypothetical protein [Flavobacterium sp.]|uniref:hypothetical protein n=1 Tax=Flavobacterium sp. TaxID=239 RepID=UPI00374CA06B